MTQYPSVGSPMFYGIFFIAVLIMIAIDMVSLNKKRRTQSGRKRRRRRERRVGGR